MAWQTMPALLLALAVLVTGALDNSSPGAAASGASATLYVAPAGDDDAMGTAAAPFATIERALTAFALSRAPSGSVLLLNGTYSLDRPVDITAAATASVDVEGGGRLKISALHPGGATLSGGIVVKGWRRSAGGGAGSQLWEAPLVSALRSYGRFPGFRQLFIDGRRANRSSFKLKNVWHATQKDLDHRNQGTTPEGPSYPAGDEAAFRLGLVTDDPAAADWPPGVVEVVWTGRLATHSDDPHHNLPWNEPRCPIERVEPVGPPTATVPHMLLRIAQPCWDNLQGNSFFGGPDWPAHAPDIPDRKCRRLPLRLLREEPQEAPAQISKMALPLQPCSLVSSWWTRQVDWCTIVATLARSSTTPRRWQLRQSWRGCSPSGQEQRG